MQSWAEIGGRIAQTRESAGLSQGELASRIGVDRTAVVRMEQGERKVSALELFRIAETLDAPPAHFLTQPPAALVSRRKTLDSPADAATRADYRLDIRLEEHARNAEWLVAEGSSPRPTWTIYSAAPRPIRPRWHVKHDGWPAFLEGHWGRWPQWSNASACI
ncbi:helix-turn-helix domain-containing protein [Streptomyces sp. INA 01156]